MQQVPLDIDPCGATLGAVVRNRRLGALTDHEFGDVLDAFHSFGVLIFPDQHLSAPEQVEFSLRLGSLEAVGSAASPHIKAIANMRNDGSIASDLESPSMKVMLGNMGWHSDSSFRTPSSKASVLSCVVSPPSGGETEFADMRAAYDDLDAALRERLGGVIATHSYLYSQGAVGGLDANFTPEQRANMGPTDRPVFNVHPATGRRSLFIGRHVYRLSGMADEDAVALLDELIEWACQPPRTYLHRWTPGDAVMWDNRCVLHRARPWDYTHARIMQHTRIAGDR